MLRVIPSPGDISTGITSQSFSGSGFAVGGGCERREQGGEGKGQKPCRKKRLQQHLKRLLSERDVEARRWFLVEAV